MGPIFTGLWYDPAGDRTPASQSQGGFSILFITFDVVQGQDQAGSKGWGNPAARQLIKSWAYQLSGLVVRASALKLGGRGFDPRPGHTKDR